MVRGPDVPASTLTTMVAVVDDPAPRLLNVQVISVVPAHDPSVATAETRDVPGGSLSLTSTLVAAVDVLLLVTVIV